MLNHNRKTILYIFIGIFCVILLIGIHYFTSNSSSNSFDNTDSSVSVSYNTDLNNEKKDISDDLKKIDSLIKKYYEDSIKEDQQRNIILSDKVNIEEFNYIFDEGDTTSN